jgi:hypothetical protein
VRAAGGGVSPLKTTFFSGRSSRLLRQYRRDISPEQINIENVYLLCMDLLANPCREIAAMRIYFAVKQQSQT